MKVLAVARKGLLEIAREPQLLALVLLAPLFFLLATALAFNKAALTTHPVLVINRHPAGAAFIEILRAERYVDGRPVFELKALTDAAEAEAVLKAQKAAMLILIAPKPDGGFGVTLRGDALYLPFIQQSSLVESLAQRYADQLAGLPETVRVEEQPLLPTTFMRTDFQLLAPGQMVFAILLIIPQTAMLLGREVRAGTLRRLRLSGLRAWELLAGVSAAQMLVAVAQVLIVFGAAAALGFQAQGSLALAMLAGLVLSFSAIGQGLIVACFVANDSQAVNYGSVFTMLEVFVSGSFFPMSAPALFTLAGHEITVFDFVPATQGMTILQQVLSYGAGWDEISFRLGLMLALSGLYFAVGVVVFQWLQMKQGGR